MENRFPENFGILPHAHTTLADIKQETSMPTFSWLI